jgi:CheY-like chemotaxis protein/HPt (histidine-containing phosphotransfer) domain-containing protein
MEKKILVVDDIPINCKVVVMHLNKLGIPSDTAGGGKDAVAACIGNRYSMVFMDLDMPDMDGYQATKLIRQYERSIGVRTPILAMSSFDREEDKQRCIREGLDGHVRKGISAVELLSVINSYSLDDTGSRFPDVLKLRVVAECMEFDTELARLGTRFEAKRAEFISEFIFVARGMLQDLERVLGDRNAYELMRIAYSLKGCCSNIELPTMAALCAEIGEDGNAGRWQRVAEKYRRLSEMLSNVQQHFAKSKISAG